MKLPRDLSGADLMKILCRDFGYQRIHQVGSHVILQTEIPAHHRIPIPEHATLRIGTLNAILNAVAKAKGIEKSEILQKL